MRTKTLEQGYDQLSRFINNHHRPDVVAYEDYRVYGWESETHKWAELHTAKLVGLIVCMAYDRGLDYCGRMAQAAKTQVTDDKLRAWGMYAKGARHARDATRHAIHYQLFGK